MFPHVLSVLCQEFPELRFTLNGGVLSYEDIEEHLSHGVAGVMIGASSVNTHSRHTVVAIASVHTDLLGGVRAIKDSHILQTVCVVVSVVPGRAITARPFYWNDVDQRIYGETDRPRLSRREVLQKYMEYAEGQEEAAAGIQHKREESMATWRVHISKSRFFETQLPHEACVVCVMMRVCDVTQARRRSVGC
jgi:tRNA-dihydrouridine synthase